MAELFLGFWVVLIFLVLVVGNKEQREKKGKAVKNQPVLQSGSDGSTDGWAAEWMRHNYYIGPYTPIARSAESVLAEVRPEAAMKALTTSQHRAFADNATNRLAEVAREALRIDPSIRAVNFKALSAGRSWFNADGFKFEGEITFKR